MTWLVMIAVGLGSYAFRLGPLLVLQRVTLSDRADRLIRNAGTAAITGLIVVSTKQSATGSAALPAVLAVSVAAVFAARRASMIRLLALGGAIYACCLIAMETIVR
ncbi:MAG: AzlD domain-containing protein [Acidimicrobiia bacterium]